MKDRQTAGGFCNRESGHLYVKGWLVSVPLWFQKPRRLCVAYCCPNYFFFRSNSSSLHWRSERGRFCCELINNLKYDLNEISAATFWRYMVPDLHCIGIVTILIGSVPSLYWILTHILKLVLGAWCKWVFSSLQTTQYQPWAGCSSAAEVPERPCGPRRSQAPLRPSHPGTTPLPALLVPPELTSLILPSGVHLDGQQSDSGHQQCLGKLRSHCSGDRLLQCLPRRIWSTHDSRGFP